jgi:polysaccharide export outer membrane protein
MLRVARYLVSIVFLTVTAVACSTDPYRSLVATTDAAATANPPQPAGAYHIRPGDGLDISFPYKPEFNQQLTVLPDGTISLPIIHSVQAGGSTVDELRQRIAQRFREIWEHYQSTEPKSYLLTTTDVIEVLHPFRPDLTRVVEVGPDGKVSLPLISTVDVQGQTTAQLEQTLRNRYSSKIDDVELNVIVAKYSGKQFVVGGRTEYPPFPGLDEVSVVVRNTPNLSVFVGGEVNARGPVAYQDRLTLMQAVILAGGKTRDASLENVLVLRDSDQPEVDKFVFVRDLRTDMGYQFYLQPRDIVLVPKTVISDVGQFLDDHLWDLFPFTRNLTYIVNPY